MNRLRKRIFLLIPFVVLSVRADAYDVVACLDFHPDNCEGPIHQFSILPPAEQAAQLPGIMDFMQRGLSDFSPKSMLAVRGASYALNLNRADARVYLPMLLQYFDLDDTHENMVESARRAVAAMGTNALPALHSAINNGNQRVMLNVIKTISQMHQISNDAVADLAGLLDYPDASISAAAKEALGRQGSLGNAALAKWESQHPASAPASAPPVPDRGAQLDTLAAQTKSPDDKQRDQAIMDLVRWELGQLQPGQRAMGLDEMARAESAIIDTLKDPTDQIRADAVLGVQHFQRYRGNARGYFMDALNDPAEKVRARAIMGMASLYPPDPGFERQLLDLLEKEFTAHPEEFLNGINVDSVYLQGVTALERIGTPAALGKAEELEHEFNIRYGEKQRLDQQKDAEARQREGESLRFHVPTWATYMIRGLFFLWFAVYIVKFPPTTKGRALFWACVVAFIIWMALRRQERFEEMKKNIATPTFQSVPGMGGR